MEYAVLNKGKKGRKRHVKRASARHHNPRSSRRHRRYTRNPGMKLGGGQIGAMALGAVGGLGASMAVNLAAPKLPAQLQSGLGKLALKGGVVVLASMFLSKFLGKSAVPIVIGAGTVVLVDGAREFIAPHVPGLSDLTDSSFVKLQTPTGVEGWELPVASGMNGYRRRNPYQGAAAAPWASGTRAA